MLTTSSLRLDKARLLTKQRLVQNPNQALAQQAIRELPGAGHHYVNAQNPMRPSAMVRERGPSSRRAGRSCRHTSLYTDRDRSEIPGDSGQSTLEVPFSMYANDTDRADGQSVIDYTRARQPRGKKITQSFAQRRKQTRIRSTAHTAVGPAADSFPGFP